jgi:hypothetical protein
MAPDKKPMRTLSIGRTVHHGGDDKPLPAVPERVPVDLVAPNGEREAESVGPAETHEQRLRIALIVPLAQYASFSRWVGKHVRVVKPQGWGGEVELCVLPDLGEDLVDFSQYGPPPTITFDKVGQE